MEPASKSPSDRNNHCLVFTNNLWLVENHFSARPRLSPGFGWLIGADRLMSMAFGFTNYAPLHPLLWLFTQLLITFLSAQRPLYYGEWIFLKTARVNRQSVEWIYNGEPINIVMCLIEAIILFKESHSALKIRIILFLLDTTNLILT